ncbi:MAG TPA: pyridoxamine 5'-phosphate oxidase [Methylomirabilota bacterium]|jgi:pyridoxamine 5'-phosphate oxidase|nr:pyridoxamine 5'-phosphate oxidase [Methylomirabilota bacterium]
MNAPLPEPLPADPLPIVERWLAEASKIHRSAAAMTLATVDPDGRPSARMVICRGLDIDAGWLVFYSDRDSRKGLALAAHPRAALVFHWESLERQIRIDGPVTPAPDGQVDAYWASRPLDARIAAIVSDQSRPIASRAALLARVDETTRRLGEAAPRPERWVGYRVWAETVELWLGQPARVHDRALWTRALTSVAGGFIGGAWRATRLQP